MQVAPVSGPGRLLACEVIPDVLAMCRVVGRPPSLSKLRSTLRKDSRPPQKLLDCGLIYIDGLSIFWKHLLGFPKSVRNGVCWHYSNLPPHEKKSQPQIQLLPPAHLPRLHSLFDRCFTGDV